MAYDPKKRQISCMCSHARDRARKNNLPFNITTKYLRTIAGDECPIFRTPFEWGPSGLGYGRFLPNGPQLDRIIPELGYVEGNVAFISHRANRIKGDGTMVEHYAIADWIWGQTRAKQKPTTPVPAGHDQQGQEHPVDGAVHGTGAGQDGDGADDHSGTIHGQYAYSGA